MRSRKRHTPLYFMAFLSLVAMACHGAIGTTSTTSAVVVPHAAERLLVDTGACWLGGIWGDLQAETPAERELSSQARCDAVVASVFGSSDRRHYLQLRAFDVETLVPVRQAIEEAARHDPDEAKNADLLGRMFEALSAAQQETTLARRAAHRVLRDLDHEMGKLPNEETLALPQLMAFDGFKSLYRMDAGDLGAERHALAMMVLLDRMRIAQDLPIHLKPYVIVSPLAEAFSAPIPSLPYDASKPLDRGAWLVYLENAAQQARHPVDMTRPQQVRYEQAMAGLLEGVADQLQADASALGRDHPLAPIIALTIRALDQSRQRVMP